MSGRTENQLSHGEEVEEQAPPLRLWILPRWPHIILWTGLLLFWFACIDSANLPLEAVFVGPVLMLAGIIMIQRSKREP
jgi:hypothetical protein